MKRNCVSGHAADVDERDPRQTTRDDVKRTLNRWPNANTRRKNRSILASFYDWTMQELTPGRVGNPARQTRAPRAVKPQVYRMTRAEVVACLGAAHTRRERRVDFLGICAGIRNHELRHLQRRHFERTGWIHISGDIAKGGRERWVPVLPELEPVVFEILTDLGPTTWDRASKQWIGSTWCPPSAGATRAATPSVWTSSSSPHPARCSARS
jgi:integrase